MRKRLEVLVRTTEEGWTAEVARPRKRKTPKVMQSQGGFESEAAAREWGKAYIAEWIRKNRERQQAQEENARKREDEARERVSDFAKELEAMHEDVHVVDARYEGHGVITMKIQTPVATYLSSGTRSDWIRQVKEDIKAVESFSCMFCKAKLSWTSGSIRCDGCGGFTVRSPEAAIAALDVTSLTPASALKIVDDLSSFVREDRKRDLLWVRKPALEWTPLEHPFADVQGPDGGYGEGELPLLLNVDNASDEVAEKVRSAQSLSDLLGLFSQSELTEMISNYDVGCPTCTMCVHAAELEDSSDSIIGVESSYHVYRSQLCVFPLNGTEIKDKHPAAFDFVPEKVRGYRTDPEGIVRNAIVERIVNTLDDVSDITRGLEASIALHESAIHGPICRNFKLNKEHPELDAFPYEVTDLKVPVRFGVVDFRREGKERQKKAGTCAR